MKRIIFIRWKKLLFCILLCIAMLFLFSVILVSIDAREVFNRLYEKLEEKLEKENSRLEGALENILPKEDKKLYEPVGRFHDDVPELSVVPLDEAIKKGRSISFTMLHDDPGYRRVVYDSNWKGFFFRGWMYLPRKNILARHRLFVYSLGGSANFDFEGELGFHAKLALDNHRNINFLIFDFHVQEIKRYNDQLVLVGTPKRSGVQIVSVVMDEILNQEETKKDLLAQLSTPGGMEVDFEYTGVVQYEYLREQIREHTVSSDAIPPNQENYDALINKNLRLQKELSYYIPVAESTYGPDNVLTKDLCKPIPPTFPLEEKSLQDMRMEGQDTPIQVLMEDPSYKRPVYDPAWKEHYRERWAFVPSQMCLNFSRLHVLTGDNKEKEKTLGMLGFIEAKKLPKENETGFIIYGFHADHCILFNRQLLFVGTTQREGVSYIIVDNEHLKEYTYYLARLITLDNEEIDYAAFPVVQ